MISLAHINTQAIRVFMGTLTEGESLHTAFARIAQQEQIFAATLDLLGGLTEVEFIEYDFIRKIRKPPLVFARPMEIVAGHGTISWLDSEPHVHIHLVLSFRDETVPNGISLIGGHAARATAFAVEFTLAAYDGVPVRRAMHKATGLSLWKLPSFNLSTSSGDHEAAGA